MLCDAATLKFHKACSLDDLWTGDTQLVEISGSKILLVHTDDGRISAVQAVCPHQGVSLAEAKLCGHVLTCPMHLWEMDAVSGTGVNPKHAELALYPTQIRDGDVYVAVDGIRAKSARP